MFEFDEEVLNVIRHTDATAATHIVLFDIDSRKFVPCHIALHTMEFLEKIKEMTEMLILTYLTPKSSTKRQNWMGLHLWRQRPGMEAAS